MGPNSLLRVVADAKVEGYIAVEGFPVVRDERYEWDCTGPLWLYKKGCVKFKFQADFKDFRYTDKASGRKI